MRVIRGSRAEAESKAAERIAALVSRKPDCVLALSASEELRGVYAAAAASGADFSRCRVFVTEEFALDSENLGKSRRAALEEMFLVPAHFSAANVIGMQPDGDADSECEKYASLWQELGVDLAVLAIGEDGHIAFDEPLAGFDSTAHPTKLIESTQREECAAFDAASAPARGMTAGIGEIMRAKSIALCAFGAGKAETVERTVAGRAHVSVPATLLQLHDDVDVYLDAESASLI